ncbi:hypothetical protein GCM10007860_34810 [Chitiniphilus shinanonensis]|uniref:Membrane-anchored protein n=1 Tax=Chitiniphilus shinanonensis TaxID=553088 RepID=A0ABQ6C2C8_9NEIS|nr:GDYXXLXY domain-containing protein [Chitiniphilus shinanonensis]GLS06303.1 hypothetical protein GCM10007860_34810 [Chitiniphilus shinanonensis]
MNANRIWVALGVALTLAVPAALVTRHERLLASGKPVLLALRPVDPRSLMQGDYMALDYDVTQAVTRTVNAEPAPLGLLRQGETLYAFLAVDAQGVGRVVRIGTAPSMARPGELALRLRWQQSSPIWFMRWAGGNAVLPSHSYFFAEGEGGYYAKARYAIWRVGDDGDALLEALADEHGRRMDGVAAPAGSG